MSQQIFGKVNKLKSISINACPLREQNKSVDNFRQPFPVNLPTKSSQQTKLTTYKNLNKNQKTPKIVGIRTDKVFQLYSKAQLMYKLRFETIFLAYSIMEKTVHILDKLESNEYFAICCLYIAMKYEQMYPPKLKQLGVLIKLHIQKLIYQKNEKLILKQLNYNLSFSDGINETLSQYLQNLSQSQKYSLFYLLQIAFSNRIKLESYSLKEIVLSAIYILCSHSIYLSSNNQIDGIKFQKIEGCSKVIILCQISNQSQFPAIHKKYRSDSMKYTSMRVLPTCDKLTKLFTTKANQQINMRKTLTKLQSLSMQEKGKKQTMLAKKECKNICKN